MASGALGADATTVGACCDLAAASSLRLQLRLFLGESPGRLFRFQPGRIDGAVASFVDGLAPLLLGCFFASASALSLASSVARTRAASAALRVEFLFGRLFLSHRHALFGRDDLVARRARKIGKKAGAVRGQKRVPCLPGADALGEFIVARQRVCSRRCSSRSRRLFLGRLRNERDGRSADRAVDVRLLLVVGRFHDLVAHAPEGNADVEAGRRKTVQQGSRKGAVISRAIGRGHPGLGGERHQRIGRRHFDLCEAAAHRA